MWYQLIQQSWIFHEYFMNHVNSWIIHESFMNSSYKYSWNLVHELWFMNISRICLDACIFKNNLPIVHEQFMNLSSWTKYDCRSWIVHEYSWIVHEYSSSHEFHFAGVPPAALSWRNKFAWNTLSLWRSNAYRYSQATWRRWQIKFANSVSDKL